MAKRLAKVTRDYIDMYIIIICYSFSLKGLGNLSFSFYTKMRHRGGIRRSAAFADTPYRSKAIFDIITAVEIGRKAMDNQTSAGRRGRNPGESGGG